MLKTNKCGKTQKQTMRYILELAKLVAAYSWFGKRAINNYRDILYLPRVL
jgi:hypothetical protein